MNRKVTFHLYTLFLLLLLLPFSWASTPLCAQSEDFFQNLNYLCDSAKKVGDFRLAIQLYESAITPQNALDSPAETGKCLHHCGRVYEALGDFDVAFDYYNRARVLYERSEDYEGIAGILNNMGYYHQIQANNDQALALYLQSLAISREHGLKKSEAINLSSLGSLHFQALGDDEKGIAYLDSSVTVSLEIDYVEGISIAYNEIAMMKGMGGDLNAAVEYYKKSYYAGLPMNDLQSNLISYNNIGSVMVELQQYDSAEFYLGKGLKLARELGAKDDMRMGYRILAHSKYQQKKYQDAYENMVTYSQYSDTVFNQEKFASIRELQVKYEADLKDREITLLKQTQTIENLQNEQAAAQSAQRIRILAGTLVIIGLLFSLAVVLFLRYRSRQRAETLATELNTAHQLRVADQEIHELEIKAVKAQLNPHFMFNALNSIQEYILLNDKKAAVMHLGNFSELMRKVLRHSEDPWISLSDELGMLTNYLNLEGLRFGDAFEFDLQHSCKVDPDDILVPSLFIQPLVENALKHGLEPKSGQKSIHIHVKDQGATLHITVEDNGIGRQAAAKRSANSVGSGMSFGLTSIRKRLDRLNSPDSPSATFTADSTLTIEDLADQDGHATGTRITITLPFIHEFQYQEQKGIVV